MLLNYYAKHYRNEFFSFVSQQNQIIGFTSQQGLEFLIFYLDSRYPLSVDFSDVLYK